MVTNTNSEISRQLSDSIKLQQTEGVPSQVTNSYSPTLEVNPTLVKKADVLVSLNASTSASSNTVLAAQTGRSFVICGYTYNFFKDATCDAATGTAQLLVTITGDEESLERIPSITTTLQQVYKTVTLARPIKLDAGTQIRIFQGTFTVGVFHRTVTVWGYWDD